MENNNINKLVVKGTIKVCGINVQNIYGGFSKDQKVMLAKTVATIHSKELKHVNELINNNINNKYSEHQFHILLLFLLQLIY